MQKKIHCICWIIEEIIGGTIEVDNRPKADLPQEFIMEHDKFKTGA